MNEWTYTLWPRAMWHLAALEYLDMINQEGSIAASAAHFNRSQGTVTTAIRKLEAELGYEVLDHQRGRSGANITPAGKQVLGWFRHLARQAQGVEAAARSLKSSPGGRGKKVFRVAASTTTCELLVPRWLRLLRDQGNAPDVSLTSTRSSLVVERLKRNNEFDVGFIANDATTDELKRDGLASQVVGSDELLIVVPPTHRWIRFHAGKITVDELVREPHLAREPGSGARDVFLNRLKLDAPESAEKLRIQSIMTNNSVALRTSVLEFGKPAALSSLAVSEQLAAGDLCEVKVEGLKPLRRSRQAIWRIDTEDELRDRLVKIARLNSFYVPKPPPAAEPEGQQT